MNIDKSELIMVRNKDKFSEILNEFLTLKFDNEDRSLEKYITQNYLYQLDFSEKLFLIMESMNPDVGSILEGLEYLEVHTDYTIGNLRNSIPLHDDEYYYQALEILETNKKAFIEFIDSLCWASFHCGFKGSRNL